MLFTSNNYNISENKKTKQSVTAFIKAVSMMIYDRPGKWAKIFKDNQSNDWMCTCDATHVFACACMCENTLKASGTVFELPKATA